MTTPEERWDGAIQDAIREHDRGLGHLPKAPATGRHIVPVDFFVRMPTGGGTVFLRPEEGSVDSEG
jgi:hypothetical protein